MGILLGRATAVPCGPPRPGRSRALPRDRHPRDRAPPPDGPARGTTDRTRARLSHHARMDPPGHRPRRRPRERGDEPLRGSGRHAARPACGAPGHLRPRGVHSHRISTAPAYDQPSERSRRLDARGAGRPHPLRVDPRPRSGKPRDRVPVDRLPRLRVRGHGRHRFRRGLELAPAWRPARTALVAGFAAALLATTPMAWNAPAVFGVENVTTPEEFQALAVLASFGARNVTTDQRLADVGAMWFGYVTDSSFPVKLRDNKSVGGFDYAIVLERWTTVGAQEHPAPNIVLQPKVLQRFLDENRVVYVAGPPGNRIFVVQIVGT